MSYWAGVVTTTTTEAVASTAVLAEADFSSEAVFVRKSL